jgi:hypothetical protein
VAFIAASPSLVQCWLTIWLSTESTEVADRSLDIIELMLAVDHESNATVISNGGRMGEVQGQGLMWRRVFNDPDVYRILFDWTSLTSSKRDNKTKKGMQMTTIAQARLWDFIVRTAGVDWGYITSSTLPDVEAQYIQAGHGNGDEPFGGLLRYATSHMTDRHDLLMEVLRQDFFLKLLGVTENDTSSRTLPPRLLEAIQHGAGVKTTKKHENGLQL